MATPTTLPASFVAGNVLTAAELNNLRGAFRVLQVVNVFTGTSANNTTSTDATTGLTATITPQSATSKILVLVNQSGCGKEAGDGGSGLVLTLRRNTTDLYSFELFGGYNGVSGPMFFGSCSHSYLDSPATTSATTYLTRFRNRVNAASVTVQQAGAVSTMTLMEISA